MRMDFLRAGCSCGWAAAVAVDRDGHRAHARRRRTSLLASTSSFMNVATALCLASGITMVGLSFGQWQHPDTKKRLATGMRQPSGG